MKVKVGNKLFNSDLEAIMIVLDEKAITEIGEYAKDGLKEARYIIFPEEKYTEQQIIDFTLLPEEYVAQQKARKEEILEGKHNIKEKTVDEKEALLGKEVTQDEIDALENKVDNTDTTNTVVSSDSELKDDSEE